MNRKTLVELTNMCMIYDHQGNVLVEEKLVNNFGYRRFHRPVAEDAPVTGSLLKIKSTAWTSSIAITPMGVRYGDRLVALVGCKSVCTT